MTKSFFSTPFQSYRSGCGGDGDWGTDIIQTHRQTSQLIDLIGLGADAVKIITKVLE